MAKLELTSRFLGDLKKIKAYSIDEFGEVTAKQYIKKISEALQTIAEYPELLRPRPFVKHTKLYFVGKHVLSCLVLEDTVYILTAKYCSMDIETILENLEPKLIQEAEILHHKLTHKRKE